MKPKTEYKIPNRNGIDVYLHHAQTTITDHTGEPPGDDEVILTIPNFPEYDTDLCQADTIFLHFSKAEARRLSRVLWQMAARLMTAEQREDASDRPEIVIDPDFFKMFGGYGKGIK